MDQNLFRIPSTTPAQAQEVKPPTINWGAADPLERGPIIGTLSDPSRRNVIGAHGSQYSLNRSMAAAVGMFDPKKRPDLTDTHSTAAIGPFPQWYEPGKIVTLDPFGLDVTRTFADLIAQGYDIRPTIAATWASIRPREIRDAVLAHRLKPDDEVLIREETKRKGKRPIVTYACPVTEIAIDPVWNLPGIADRLGISELDLRRALVEQSGGMYPDLVTRQEIPIFLPPNGQTIVVIFGDTRKLGDPNTPVTVRVHDACVGSDVLDSDICTCRPYLALGFEECIRCAQEGGLGIIVYFEKEGRGLGSVTKLMVYNKRHRQTGGDSAANYFWCTEVVAGFRDARFQMFMPDILHWLGLPHIRLVSMSNDKYDAIVNSGIKVVERVELPDDRIPGGARVEIEAKKAAGYFTRGSRLNVVKLAAIKGRKFD